MSRKGNMAKKQDPRIDKRRVTMTSWLAVPDGKGGVVNHKHEAVDYVRPDILEAYLQDARRIDPKTGQPHWQVVTVSDEPDAGPGGYHGPTHVPAQLDHPLAGQTFPATEED